MSEMKNEEMRKSEFAESSKGRTLEVSSLANYNIAIVNGIIEGEFEYSHEVKGEKYYKTRLISTRLRGRVDFVPIMVSESIIKPYLSNMTLTGKPVNVVGPFKSCNRTDQLGIRHLILFLEVKHINFYDDVSELAFKNKISLEGEICKPPILRKTPLGRQITDFIVAVRGFYGKNYYIPCIAWGLNAVKVDWYGMRKRIKLYGRIQSRRYFKKYSPDSEEGEYRIAYEISAISVDRI